MALSAPHLPTAVWVLAIVLVFFAAYHVTLGRH